ncbi:tRNA (N(6)-L-threonylcarbamoyladenosine(37)-C(2))-methylthiotransferase MtaB [Spirochaetia bacterium]|nr:tRNA (N(6)-L-threonylcarbamoyladenosine(37)-C(2))-methylthiotransferase MtaB [Spirochaetia bacterium]GHU35188.1 tRNA (N(6)-L-threonylcarbamoyladenosine(37)-C(2))-methylthiotransferase MtaB [Spirochaetia bacterium]
MRSIALHTLGCKLNQLESESLGDSFVRAGWTVVSLEDRADLGIINTCTVTGKAEQKARRIIRKFLAENPDSPLIVTGCYAQLNSEELGGIDPRVFVVPGNSKYHLHDLASALESGKTVLEFSSHWSQPDHSEPFSYNPQTFSFHSRAFLKIQDGCNNHCSFCRVSLARGKSVSRSADEICRELQNLEGYGFTEAVLTGVNIGQYQDPAEGFDLAGLIAKLLETTDSIRIRLSSLEPELVRPHLLPVLASQRVRPHFHLSVQSGSEMILQSMRRAVDPAEILTAVESLRSIKKDPFIAVDIIAGFPGENEAEFEKTYTLCRNIGCAWIHAFPYSKRPGTEAFNFSHAVPEREARNRVERLLNLGRSGKREYIDRWIGETVEAVVEQKGLCLSENYLKIKVDTALEPRSLIQCRISTVSTDPHFDAEGHFR